MTFSATLALYVCTTAAYYITTPQTECMAEQEAAAAQIKNPTPYLLQRADRKNWKGEVVGRDYVFIARHAN